jgi:hypothetical protein
VTKESSWGSRRPLTSKGLQQSAAERVPIQVTLNWDLEKNKSTTPN